MLSAHFDDDDDDDDDEDVFVQVSHHDRVYRLSMSGQIFFFIVSALETSDGFLFIYLFIRKVIFWVSNIFARGHRLNAIKNYILSTKAFLSCF